MPAIFAHALSPPPAPSPCLKAKLDGAGKSVSARLKCWAKAAAKATPVDPLCLSKEQAKLLTAFGTADTKAACVQIGDASAAEAVVSTCVGNVLGLLPPSTTSTTTTTPATTTTTLSGPCSGSEPAELAGVLAAHNAVRASAWPTPVPALPPLCWSETAAAVAQAYADRCTWQHSTLDERFGMGENLAARAGGSLADLLSWAVTDGWGSSEAGDCSVWCGGHYSQIVWRSTEAVGCGVKHCTGGFPPLDPDGTYDWWFLVCNYDPAGNIPGELPY